MNINPILSAAVNEAQKQKYVFRMCRYISGPVYDWI